MHQSSRRPMRGATKRVETSSSHPGNQHHYGRSRNERSRSSQRTPHRKSPPSSRTLQGRRSPSPRLLPMRREERVNNRIRIPSREKAKPVGDYKREFWSSDFADDANPRPLPIHGSNYSRPGCGFPRSHSSRTRGPFHGVPARRVSTDNRTDNFRRSDVIPKYSTNFTSRNEPPVHKEYGGSFRGRTGRMEDYPKEVYGYRSPQNMRPVEHRAERNRIPLSHFHGIKPLMPGEFEPRSDRYRPDAGGERRDYAETRLPYSPRRNIMNESRPSREYDRHFNPRRSFERGDYEAGFKRLSSPGSRVPRNTQRSGGGNPQKTSMPKNARSLPEVERYSSSKPQSGTTRESTSSKKRGFNHDLRPEDILVTRKYENTTDQKDCASKPYHEEERWVKIVRDSAENITSSESDKGSRNAGRKRLWSQESDRVIESDISSGIPAERPFADLHGDTDERLLNSSVRSQIEVRQYRSKSHDFGDKDDRPDRSKVMEKGSFPIDKRSDDTPLNTPRRSESRDEEKPRERFDRKVNTRDPDDLRNSLARRQKKMKAATLDRASLPRNGRMTQKASSLTSREPLKRQSSDASPSKLKESQDSPSKRRRLSESHHLKPVASVFKKPIAFPRRDFGGFHPASSYAIRGRRYSTQIPSGGRVISRDFVSRRSRPFPGRGFGIRR